MDAPEQPREEIGVREFARRIDVSPSAVSQAIKAGRLAPNENGKLIWPDAAREWETKRVRGGSGVTADDYYLHRAETELWRARNLELEYEQKAGNLISREDAERDGFRLGRILRDNIFAVPARTASTLAAERDERECYNLLMVELRVAVESILNAPQDRQTYLNAIFTPDDCVEYLRGNPAAAAEVQAALAAIMQTKPAKSARSERPAAKKATPKKKTRRKS